MEFDIKSIAKKRISDAKAIFKNLEKDHISESSAQCAYYMVLSFVPFMILFLTLIQFTGVKSSDIFNLLSDVVPESMRGSVIGIIEELYTKSIGTISISLIFTIYAAARGLYGLIKGLHLIYNYTDNKKRSSIYLRLRSFFQTIIFIIVTVILLVVLVFGKPIIETLKENFGIFQNFGFMYELLLRIIFIGIGFFICLIVYRFVPSHKLKLKNQIGGALFSSIGINLMSIIFSNYISFSNYSVTYGSLSTLLSIMIWTYMLFYILFLGAEINKFFYTRKEKERKKLIKSIKNMNNIF